MLSSDCKLLGKIKGFSILFFVFAVTFTALGVSSFIKSITFLESYIRMTETGPMYYIFLMPNLANLIWIGILLIAMAVSSILFLVTIIKKLPKTALIASAFFIFSSQIVLIVAIDALNLLTVLGSTGYVLGFIAFAIIISVSFICLGFLIKLINFMSRQKQAEELKENIENN